MWLDDTNHRQKLSLVGWWKINRWEESEIFEEGWEVKNGMDIGSDCLKLCGIFLKNNFNNFLL
jgi:hypothetical protein